VMALTFRRAFARRDQGWAALLLALGAAAGTVIAVAVLTACPDFYTHALNAAGSFKGTPIPEVQVFVEKLKGSLVWLGITLTSLVVAVIALMFLAGHSRAHDLAIKTGVGLLILASISGIVA
jgi:Rieske Fe-S protein